MRKFLSNCILQHEEVLKVMFEKLDQRSLLVDVGCGDEEIVPHLARYFETVVGVDCNEALIENLKTKNTLENVSYKVGKAERLPVDQSSVDLLTAVSTVTFFNPSQFMKEVNRVLKPGGCVAIVGCGYPVIRSLEFDHVLCDFNVCLKTTSLQPTKHEDFRDAYAVLFDDIVGYDKTWSEYKHVEDDWGLETVEEFLKSIGAYGKHQPHERGEGYEESEVDAWCKKCLGTIAKNARDHGVAADEFRAVTETYLILATKASPV